MNFEEVSYLYSESNYDCYECHHCHRQFIEFSEGAPKNVDYYEYCPHCGNKFYYVENDNYEDDE